MDGPAHDELAEERKNYVDKCELKLIFSSDLQGSTALKRYGHIDAEEPWLLPFELFYEHFPRVLTEAYDHHIPPYCNKLPFMTELRLQVFKFVGDEILFEVSLERHEQLLYHIHAAKEAVKEFNRQVAEKYGSLRCKPTAWIVAFPVTNSKVFIPCPQGKGPCAVDFIGPHMDCGFRLSRHASMRKFIVAFDLAEMLINALSKAKDKDDSRMPCFYYDGNHPLPGVLHDMPYPIIWIDLFDGNAPLQDRLTGVRRDKCNHYELRQFCEDFRTQHGIFSWFIKTDTDAKYCGPDDKWIRRYLNIQDKRAAFRAKGQTEKAIQCPTTQ